jgi:hypothetical protein
MELFASLDVEFSEIRGLRLRPTNVHIHGDGAFIDVEGQLSIATVFCAS